jgi:hypothetical protein
MGDIAWLDATFQPAATLAEETAIVKWQDAAGR